ncbi:ubiquitin family, partial [Bifidobacterium eulemuris]
MVEALRRSAEKAALFALLMVFTTLAVVFALGMFPAQAQAQEQPVVVGAFTLSTTDEGGLVEDTDYTYKDGTLTITTEKPVTVGMSDAAKETIEYTDDKGKSQSVFNGTTTDTIVVAADADKTANVTFDNVAIDRSAIEGSAAVRVSSGSLNLTLKNVNVLKSGLYCAGLQSEGRLLSISGEEDGFLSATGGRLAAGVGGGSTDAPVSVVISGGTVVATGGVYGGAGVGGGYGARAQVDVEISGGVVIATGGENGAGVGGGYGSRDSVGVEISGGTVVATGGGYAAGIGGGSWSNDSIDVRISGGWTTAKAGGYATAIGDGSSCKVHATITITGGLFADTSGVPASMTKVYGVAPADGYVVKANDDAATAGAYPVKVVSRTGDFHVSGGKYGTDYTYSDAGHVLTIKTAAALTVSMSSQADDQVSYKNPTDEANPDAELTIPNGTKQDRIVVNMDDASAIANVTFDGVAIDRRDDYSGGDSAAAVRAQSGSLDLTLKGDSVLKSGTNCAGLQTEGRSLSISGDGFLSVTGGSGAAGVGGGNHTSAAVSVVISGGTVVATGGGYAAGVGGGWQASAAVSVVISGGTVVAKGDSYAAGIGGGDHTSDSGSVDVVVSGGTVVARGDHAGAGIGGGFCASGSVDVVVSGGTVTSTGGWGAAGVGGGYYARGSVSVEIPGGQITAQAGSADAAAIGDGADRQSGVPDAEVSITGGVFADRTSDDPSSATMVYRQVPADGYLVYANDDEDSSSAYPLAVGRDPVLTFGSVESKVYDGSAVSVSASVLQDAAADGVVVSLRYRSADAGAGESAWTGEAPSYAGSYVVEASVKSAEYKDGPKGARWAASVVTEKFTIDCKPLSYRDVSVSGKVYDGTVDASGSATLDDGVVASDEGKVSLVVSAAFGDASAGEGKPVTVSLALAGGRSSNYTLGSNATYQSEASISRRPVAVVGGSDSLVYTGGVLSVGSYTVSEPDAGTGLLDGHVLSVSYEASGTAVGEHEGKFGEPSVTAGGEDVTSNYAVELKSGKVTVVQSSGTVTADSYKGDDKQASFTYGDTITVRATVTATGNKPGAVVFAAPRGLSDGSGFGLSGLSDGSGSSSLSDGSGSSAPGTAALYLGDKELPGDMTVTDNKDGSYSFELEYDTSRKGVPIEDGQSLTVRFSGNANVAD